MGTHQDIRDMTDIESMIEQLSSDVDRLHGPGHPSLQEVQTLANALARVRLALNDLERREACQGMPSREMAERCVGLWSRIRVVQNTLDRSMRREEA